MPTAKISVKSAKLSNLNEHLFTTHEHQQTAFNIEKIKQTQTNTTQQPVLFEHVQKIELTRSQYIVTSYLDFTPYYKGFNALETFANRLATEISELSEIEMPYFIRLDRDEKGKYDEIFRIHKVEVQSLIGVIEKQKVQFNKIIDHMTMTTEKVKPKDPNVHERQKRGFLLGVFDFLFGGNSNSATIEQIKQNLAILEQNQGILADGLEDQLKLINNQNVQISQNRIVVNSLNRELIQLNNSLNGLAESMKVLTFSRNFILAMLQTRHQLDTLRDGLHNLQSDLNRINDYMHGLTTHKVTPNLIPPTDLRQILDEAKDQLKANPKLMLPDSQGIAIWKYYQFLKINAFVYDDIIIIILTLPLVDKDLQFDLFRAHNLPLLQPNMKKLFQYDLDTSYVAVRKDGNYLTLPNEEDILTCHISAGHFCNLNTPLYPVKTTTFCIYHLLVNDLEKINKFCTVSVLDYVQDVAINLGENTWALSTLNPTNLHVTCLTNSYEIPIYANLQLVELGNSCQAYNPNLILPSGNAIRTTRNQSMIEERFFNYNLQYTSLKNFHLTQVFKLTTLSPDQIDQLAHDLPPIKRIPMKNISTLMQAIDKDYPFEMPIYGYVLITMAVTTLIILIVGIILYVRYKRAKVSSNTPTRTHRPLPTKDEIEMQPLSLTTTNTRLPHRRPVTPQLLRRTLEEDLGVDFRKYNRKSQKQNQDPLGSVV